MGGKHHANVDENKGGEFILAKNAIRDPSGEKPYNESELLQLDILDKSYMKMPNPVKSKSNTSKVSKSGSQGRKRSKGLDAKPSISPDNEETHSKQLDQAQDSKKNNLPTDRPPTSPDLFAHGKTTHMASALPIWEASNILTQRKQLPWGNDSEGKLCYAKKLGDGKGALHFWLTDDLDDEYPATLAGAAALAVIDTLDIRAACMHLLYAAYAAHLDKPWDQELVISDQQIEDYLGLKKRTDKNKQQKLALIEEIAKQPCKIATYISWPKQGKIKGFTIEEGRLWHLLGTRYHFQEDLFGNKELTGMTFIVKAGLWAKYFLNEEGRKARTAYYQCGTLSKALLEDVMGIWQHREGAARLMVWLLFKTKLDRQYPLSVQTLMEVAYGREKIQQAKGSSELRKKLANSWDDDLLTLHERGWKLSFDSATYPPAIQPAGFGRGDCPRPRGFFEQLLAAHIWVNPQEDLMDQALTESKSSKVIQTPAIPEYSTQIALTGTELKVLRTARGWSQRKLFALTGISQGLISLIESGARAISPENELLLRETFAQNP